MKKITIINLPREDVMHKNEIAAKAEQLIEVAKSTGLFPDIHFSQYDLEETMKETIKKEITYDSDVSDIMLRKLARFYIPIVSELPASHAARELVEDEFIYLPVAEGGSGGIFTLQNNIGVLGGSLTEVEENKFGGIATLVLKGMQYGSKAVKAAPKILSAAEKYGTKAESALQKADSAIQTANKYKALASDLNQLRTSSTVSQPQPQYYQQPQYQGGKAKKLSTKKNVSVAPSTNIKTQLITLATDTLIKYDGKYYLRARGEKINIIGFEIKNSKYDFFHRSVTNANIKHDIMSGMYTTKSFILADSITTKKLPYTTLDVNEVGLDKRTLDILLENVKYQLRYIISYRGAQFVNTYIKNFATTLKYENTGVKNHADTFDDKDGDIEALYQKLDLLWYAQMTKNTPIVKKLTMALEHATKLELEEAEQHRHMVTAAAASLTRDSFSKSKFKRNYIALTKAQQKVIDNDIALQAKSFSARDKPWKPIVKQLFLTGNTTLLHKLKPYIKKIDDFVRDKEGDIIMCIHKFDSYTKPASYIFKKYLGNNPEVLGFSKVCRICGERLDDREVEGMSRTFMLNDQLYDGVRADINKTVWSIIQNRVETSMNKSQLIGTVSKIIAAPIIAAETKLKKDSSLTIEAQESLLNFYITLYAYTLIVKLVKTPKSGINMKTDKSPYETIIRYVFTSQYGTVKKYNIDIKEEIQIAIDELKKVSFKIENVKTLNNSLLIANDPTYTYLYYITKLAKPSIQITDVDTIIGKKPSNSGYSYDSINKVNLSNLPNTPVHNYIRESYNYMFNVIKNFTVNDKIPVDLVEYAKIRAFEKSIKFIRDKLWFSYPKKTQNIDDEGNTSPLNITWSKKGVKQKWNKITITNGKTTKTFDKKELKAGDVPKSWKVVTWVSITGDRWNNLTVIHDTFKFIEPELLTKYYKFMFPGKKNPAKLYEQSKKPRVLFSNLNIINQYKPSFVTWTPNITKFSAFVKLYKLNYFAWLNLGIQGVAQEQKEQQVLEEEPSRYMIVNSYYKNMLLRYHQLYNYKIMGKIHWVNTLLSSHKNRDLPKVKSNIDMYDVETNFRTNYLLNGIIDASVEMSKTTLGKAFVEMELHHIMETDKAYKKPPKIIFVERDSDEQKEEEELAVDEVIDEKYNDNEEENFRDFDDEYIDDDEESSDLFGF